MTQYAESEQPQLEIFKPHGGRAPYIDLVPLSYSEHFYPSYRGSKAKPYRPAQTTRYDDKQRLNSNIYPMCQDTRAKTFTENLGANLPNEARRYKSQQMVTNNVVLKSSHRQVH